MNSRRVALLGLAAFMAGCSALDRGPEPSNYVGPVGASPHAITDPTLMAVSPVAEATAVPTDIPGHGNMAATMPSATEPTTTRPTTATNPATHPGLGQGASISPASPGKTAVPEKLTLQQAILIGLQNNISLRVQRYNVPINRTAEDVQRAKFDPSVSGTIQGGRQASPIGGGFAPPAAYSDSIDANFGIQEFFPTGTTVSGTYNTSNSFGDGVNSSSGVQLSVTQALLRGAGIEVNLVGVREAELATKVSQYQLRGFAATLVDNIEETYWNLAYAERQVVIVQNALDVAKAQLDQTNEFIRVQKVAPSERAAAEAQVALQKESLINAKSTLETTRLQFLQLITPAGTPFWNRTVEIETLPFIPTGALDPVDRHVAVALRLRPDVNEAKLELQRGDLNVVQTKNGLLPDLSFFITLGKTGFAKSFGPSNEAINGPEYSATAGISGSYDLGNRAAHAVYRASLLTRDQLVDTLNNLYQTVQVDIRTQYIEVERTRQQIDATHATRVAQDEAVRVEREKFRLGRSTSLLVAEAENQLLADQLAEVQAVTTHLNALVALYRLEGSLLARRGINAPGAEPVKNPAWYR